MSENAYTPQIREQIIAITERISALETQSADVRTYLGVAAAEIATLARNTGGVAGSFKVAWRVLAGVFVLMMPLLFSLTYSLHDVNSRLATVAVKSDVTLLESQLRRQELAIKALLSALDKANVKIDTREIDTLLGSMRMIRWGDREFVSPVASDSIHQRNGVLVFRTSEPAAVVAAADGIVTTVHSDVDSISVSVTIGREPQETMVYDKLAAISVREGERISQAQRIGVIRSDEPLTLAYLREGQPVSLRSYPQEHTPRP